MCYFCTYFDHYYLQRGLALYRSLKHHCPSFQLWVLCMDRACYDVLSQLGLPDVHLIALEDFERGDEELLRAKQNRTLIEYYFTCTPSLPLFILNNYPEVDLITYLDADLFFFADPAPIYDEVADHSIAIIGHRFPPNLRGREQRGIYNVGWLSFRRNEYAFACLHWWRERCIEWCYDRVEDGRFADQKYLDDWPDRFQDVVVLRNKGANLAPWNLTNYNIHGDRHCVWVDEQPLIFFHFHGFKQINVRVFDPNLTSYRVRPRGVMFRNIYTPYIRMLSHVTEYISPLLQKCSLPGGIRSQVINPTSPQHVPLLRRVAKKLMRKRRLIWMLYICKGVLTRKYILVVNGRVI